MKKVFLGLVTVLLALGVVLTGCMGPLDEDDSYSLPSLDVTRSIITGGWDPNETFKFSSGTTQEERYNWVTFTGDAFNGTTNCWYFRLTGDDKVTFSVYCGDIHYAVSSEYVRSSINEFYGEEIADKLMAAATYIKNKYGGLETTDPSRYTVINQATIWSIIHNITLTNCEYSDVLKIVRDIVANIDLIREEWSKPITMEGTNDKTVVGDSAWYGPYKVSGYEKLGDFDYVLAFSSGADKAVFVDADGNEITQVKSGQAFYVKVPAGAVGQFEFTASAAADYAADYYFFVNKKDPRRPNDDLQPLFKPFFYPILFTCGASFNIKPPVAFKGDINIEKTVDGINIAAWVSANKAKYQFTNINDLISFNLYKVDGDGAPLAGAPLTKVNLDAAGTISFKGLADGWYAVEEVLSAAGAKVFAAPAGVKYILLANGLQYGESNEFDYSATYSIYNGHGGGYVLGYPNLNNSGDIFPIAVDGADGTRYWSFCGNAGSVAFAPDGYMIALKMDRGSSLYADFVKAYNYIENKYGNLNENRPLAQILTWYVLGAIEYPSVEFDAINWAAIEAGGSSVAAVADAKAKAADTISNFRYYQGDAKIVDVVYMVGKNYVDDYINGQPQYVPIYSGKGEFKNTALPPPPPVISYGPSYGSVTATNAGNVPLILAGLNPKNGNPFYGDKKEKDTPFVVPNSNHFTFSVLDRAALAEGIELDMVVGNKYDIVGKAFVKLVGNNLEITIYGKGSFGAMAFSQLPVPNNGNIHSGKCDMAFGSLVKWNANLKVDGGSTVTIPCPAGNTIWLYIHGDFQFIK